jgi:hypothetical protein
MPSIGAYSFLTLKGAVDPGVGEQLEDITRPGVDGMAYRCIGRKGRPFQMDSTVDVVILTPGFVINGYQALQGTIVTIVDECGMTWTNYMVLSVEHRGTRRIRTVSGGLSIAPAYLISASWILQYTQ